MKVTYNSSGFSAVAVLLLVVVVGVLGFAGFTVANRQPASTADVSVPSQSANYSPTADDVVAAPPISSSGDLTKAEAVLNSTDTENDSDNAQLESELAAI